MSAAAGFGDDGLLDRIAQFAETRSALALVGGWAFAEAIVVPVVPDVALGLLALAAPRQALALFVAVVLGAIAGSLVLAVLATGAPAEIERMLLALPAIDGTTLATVEVRLASDGVAGFAQVGAGPPLKVYTATWIASGGGVASLVAGVILNRMTRVGPVVAVAALAGSLMPDWLRRHERLVIAGYVLAWTGFYAVYWAT
jgi:hypothetical protein